MRVSLLSFILPFVLILVACSNAPNYERVKVERSEDGSIKREVLEGEGKRIVKTYGASGTLRDSLVYVDGQLHGTIRKVTEDGKILKVQYEKGVRNGRISAYYEEGLPHYENERMKRGKKVGEWVFYDREGHVKRYAYYEEGEAVLILEYGPDGQVTNMDGKVYTGLELKDRIMVGSLFKLEMTLLEPLESEGRLYLLTGSGEERLRRRTPASAPFTKRSSVPMADLNGASRSLSVTQPGNGGTVIRSPSPSMCVVMGTMRGINGECSTQYRAKIEPGTTIFTKFALP